MTFIKNYNLNYFFQDFLALGNIFFLLGIFFLPSALPVGAILLLISIFISFSKNKENLLKNKFNLAFFICLMIILLSTFYNVLWGSIDDLLNSPKSIILINLFNWIPIYLAFLGFQIYLKSDNQRLLFQKFLIAGTIPVIASCIMHKFLNIYGPLKTLFGTIVWFNYEYVLGNDLPDIPGGGVSGLFNNPNYLGIWLTLCLPFAISLLSLEKIKWNKIILYIINFLIIFFIFSTNSRNAFLGLLICFLLTFGIRKFIYFTFFIFVGFFLFNFIEPNIINLNNSYLLNKLSNFELNLDSPRIAIWNKAVFFIFQKPILGWGSGSMPYLTMFFPPYQNYQHTHNMIIELAYSFGIPLAIFVLTCICLILKRSYEKLNSLNKSSFKYVISKAYIISFLIFLFSHLNDVTYYDGKISILFSALLASLVKIIDQENLQEEKQNLI